MALDADGAGNPSSSSGSARRWKYQVFLSFRGEDTRRNFTDHLYGALERKGIITFRDDEKLEKGEAIKPSLLQAIEESLSAIVVLSSDYASSTWCLDELLKILHSKKEMGLHVFPIFYGVDPSDVRHQKGSFAEAFKRHEENFTKDKMKVQTWRDALKEVADLAGWHSVNWHETKLIEIVIEKVWSKLYDELPYDKEMLVGIESKITELDSVVANGLGGVRFIGIWGTGGLGKTTLAREFFERMHKDFDVHCFLHNVREASYEKNGLISLQRKLLSSLDKRSMDVGDYYEGRRWIKGLFCNRKVLLVLDDVSDINQLDNLAGKQEWFGNGSRIIITTRDKHLLPSGSAFYEIKFMSENESLELFHYNAFKGNKPNEDYLELSRTVIQYAGGLPLALKVSGSFLCGRNISEWNDAIAKFRKVPPNDILKILRVSFDGLEDDEKTIFLDIACFFKGQKEDYVTQILQNLDLHPIIGIKVLIDKSLVSIDGGILWMHDMLQEMGKYIVSQESPNDSGKRSRIWSWKDANHVLDSNKGTEAIRGIVLIFDKPYVLNWDPEAFSKISNLKLLVIVNRLHWTLHHGPFDNHDYHLNLCHGLKCLSNALKVIEWDGCPLDALPSQVPVNDELVDLKLQHSQLKQLWKETQVLKSLKSIDLRNSRYLMRTPNFNEIPNLQKLILEGCINLVDVHPSLGRHRNLVIVNLKDCKSIKTLPRKFEMECLEIFILSGCSKVRQLPEFGENMECLSELDLEETAVIKLPQSIANLTGLTTLNLRNCKNLVCIPNVVQYWKCIRNLYFSGCSKLSRLPEYSNQNVSLEELDASGTAITEVPSSIVLLKNMKKLSFSGCTWQAQSSSWDFASFFNKVFRLERPSASTGLMLPPSLSCLSSLKGLDLSFCNLYDESLPNDINGLSSLKGLDLRGNNFVHLPTSFISNLLKLDSVFLNHCPRLQILPRLPSNLRRVYASDCPSMNPLLGSVLWEFFERIENQVILGSKMEFRLDQLERWPFVLNVPGSEVPSWFHNENYFYEEERYFKPNVSFIADIPNHCHSSKCWGIAVCLVVEGDLVSTPVDFSIAPCLVWKCRDVFDEFSDLWVGYTFNEQCYCHHQLFLLFFRFVDVNRLQMIFSIHNEDMRMKYEIRKCGWRMACKEDVETWRKTNGESCSTSNLDISIDSDNFNTVNQVMRVTEATWDHFTGNENESAPDVDPQSHPTKCRKFE